MYSVFDKNGTLMENAEASAVMLNALCVQMKSEKGMLNLKSKRFERLQGATLADMIEDKEILAGINLELNAIAK